MSAISKSKKCETYQQKITNLLIIERHVLVNSYFCTRVSYLLDFDTNDIVSFDTNLGDQSDKKRIWIFIFIFILNNSK